MFYLSKRYRVYQQGNGCYLLSTMNPRYSALEDKRRMRERNKRNPLFDMKQQPTMLFIERQLIIAFILTITLYLLQ